MLTPQEAESLFETLRVMAAEGRTVIFISHKLHEVKAVSDRVTVLRAGKNVATVDTADSTPRSLASLMVGPRRRGAGAARRGRPRSASRCSRCAASRRVGDRGGDALRDVSLTVGAGEIVAIAGVAGNGQRELAETVTGMRSASAGSVVVAGKALRGGDAREAIRAQRRARSRRPAAHRRRAVAVDRVERRPQVLPRPDGHERPDAAAAHDPRARRAR